MRHFHSFLQQVRNLNELAARFEAEIHYCRLDAVVNTLTILKETCTYWKLGKSLGVSSAHLAAMLGRRMEDDHANAETEALSSALIVNSTGKSGPGFFEKARSLGYPFKDEEKFWKWHRDTCIEEADVFYLEGFFAKEPGGSKKINPKDREKLEKLLSQTIRTLWERTGQSNSEALTNER